jgi:hypothetical protein
MAPIGLSRRFRTVAIALAVTFLTNYAISMAIDNGASNPPPRPYSTLDNGASNPPPRPAPDSFDNGASNPPPRP